LKKFSKEFGFQTKHFTEIEQQSKCSLSQKLNRKENDSFHRLQRKVVLFHKNIDYEEIGSFSQKLEQKAKRFFAQKFNCKESGSFH
jgi:hypothetical protein